MLAIQNNDSIIATTKQKPQVGRAGKGTHGDKSHSIELRQTPKCNASGRSGEQAVKGEPRANKEQI